MVRISLSWFFCTALAVALVAGCGSPTTPSATTNPPTAEVLVFEVEEIELAPGDTKDVKVTTGKAESAEAPKDSGVTAKVADGKVTVSASKEAKEGTHEVKVKGGKKDATIKVKVKKEK
jgi:hypothetical protein